jgi:hypothetical protein
VQRPIRSIVTRALAVAAAVSTALLVAVPAQPASAKAVACGSTASRLDVNGDGYDDAVIGNPYATVDGKLEAGSITILFGDADCRIGEGKRMVLTEGSFPGSTVEAGDHFGWSVSIGDLNGTGAADILVGAPGEDWQGHVDAGIAEVISFLADEPGGPLKPTAEVIDQAMTTGVVEAGDEFGYSTAIIGVAGDFTAGAIGAPGEDNGTRKDVGEVDSLLYLRGDLYGGDKLREGTSTIPGAPTAGDKFGFSLLFTDLYAPSASGPAHLESALVVGAPGETVNGHANAGAVFYLDAYDYSFPYEANVQEYTQDSPGVPGVAETGDQFGYSLAADGISLSMSTPHDVAVGAPGEDIGSAVDAGGVTVFADQRSGWKAIAALTQNTAHVPGVAETGDRFGHSLAMRPASNGLAAPELVVSAPYEDIGSTKDAGTVETFTVGGSAVKPGAVYTENSAGTPGTVAAGNRFGLALGAAHGVVENLFTVSSPYHGDGSVFVVSGTSTRSWVPGKDGVPASTSGTFGWSVASGPATSP